MSYILALDSANETLSIGIGVCDASTRSIHCKAHKELLAQRASNQKLIPCINDLCAAEGIQPADLSAVVCGRGPGSFTGVRICVATAKGIASALRVPLVGVSTLDAVAWGAWLACKRGDLVVVADAMRKELYPVRYKLSDEGIERLDADSVIKAQEFADHMNNQACKEASLCGDALVKYESLFSPEYPRLSQELWTPTGAGLLLAVQDLWRKNTCNILSYEEFLPASVLPVYTRLSDAEENERIRLAKHDPKNLTAGVSEEGLRKDRLAQKHEVTLMNAQESLGGYSLCPLDASRAAEVARLEQELFEGDAWSESLVKEDLAIPQHLWWAAYEAHEGRGSGKLVAYAGACVSDGRMELLKVAVARDHQRQGLAAKLIALCAHDARDLGATLASLEVRASNRAAQKLYENLGLTHTGTRPRYYEGEEDALIFEGPLPVEVCDIAGMRLQTAQESSRYSDKILDEGSKEGIKSPLILAIESSCDETAAALIDGTGAILSDVLASQIDFHARFGGVVPEIASRKHIEAICGVCDVALEQAQRKLSYQDLDAIAATNSPGLVGALVVGLAFAKGLAWALEKPLIGVNHLEGHLYANKIADPTIKPPFVASLVSGGHTLLVHAKNWGEYETLGSTIDDAVGEAFDKVAKALGLGYPGGPVISRLAQTGDPRAIDFPRALMHSKDLRFSLSGLKTAVITYIQKEQSAGRELNIPNIAASFQQAVIDVQVKKVRDALVRTGAKTFCLGGGVAANPALRRAYENMAQDLQIHLVLPPLSACTDNASMIALVALDEYKAGNSLDFSSDVAAHAPLDDITRSCPSRVLSPSVKF